ncbi:MAG: HAMP domain-containing histidine kinase [Leptonema illini]|jgi:signal transduction histidine kinase|uniref:histidine kinase n=1 Tax=Leptonema illini TaxID=183 RepID=A0A833H033_9LEPT|nr:MAG: HAMP domain-containing histidine kinase [Leptonema illini]
MKNGTDRVFGHPGLYLGLMFLVISAQLFWWLLFFAEIRFALVHVQDERDRILEMALNGDPGLVAPPYIRLENGRYTVDREVVEARRHERDRNVVMIIAEASFFLAVFGAVSIILVKLYRSERQLAKEQELFLNSFTHELKTPLAAIKLNLQTLKKRPDHAATPELVEGSLREVEILNRRISEILLGCELSSEQSNEKNGAGEGTAFFPILERTIGELHSLIKERKAVITVGWLPPITGRLRSLLPSGSQIPEALVEKVVVDRSGIVQDNLLTLQTLEESPLAVEPRELGSVIGELITNALIYSGELARLRILLRQKGRRMQLFFVDNGPGIPYAERKNIFRPMVRLQRQSGFVPGTGMGLANVRALLLRRAGSIRLLPSPEGARFLVEISIKKSTSGAGHEA